MKPNGNLLIIGDSFCQNDQYWPSYLRTHLTYTRDNARVLADPGAGWWSIRANFLKIKNNNPAWVDALTTTVFIHTFSGRVHCRDPNTYKTVMPKLSWNWSNKDFDEAAISLSLYYKYLYDEKFHDWAQIKWFDELADIFQAAPNMLTVHLFADTATYDLVKYSRLNCIDNKLIIPTPLMDIVNLQYPVDFDPDRMANDGNSGFYNHFTPHNNIVFANQIYEMLTSERTDFDLTQFTPHE